MNTVLQMAAELYPSATCHHMLIIEGLCAGIELFRESVLPPHAELMSAASLMLLIRTAYIPRGYVVADFDSRLKTDEYAIRLALECGVEGLRQGLEVKAGC